MFIGGYEYNCDEKGRVIIPPKFRDDLTDKFVITKGMGGCLFVIPEHEWRTDFVEKFKARPILDANTIKLSRFFCGSAVTTAIDNQGRAPISELLRDYAGIEPQKPVMIVGVSNHLEMWSKARWDEYNSGLTDDDLILCANSIGVGQNVIG